VTAVLICDEITTLQLASLPFQTFEKRTVTVNKSEIKVIKLNTSCGEFTSFLTLGAFNFTCKQKAIVFGRHGGISFLNFKSGTQDRRLVRHDIWYLDEKVGTKVGMACGKGNSTKKCR